MSVELAANTEVRDASNYKQAGRAVFAGTLDTAQVDAMRAVLDEGTWFLPGQVGLAELQRRWPSHYDDDHVWHELTDVTPTDAAPTDARPATQFAAEFASQVWDEQAAMDRLTAWIAATPQGH